MQITQATQSGYLFFQSGYPFYQVFSCHFDVNLVYMTFTVLCKSAYFNVRLSRKSGVGKFWPIDNTRYEYFRPKFSDRFDQTWLLVAEQKSQS